MEDEEEEDEDEPPSLEYNHDWPRENDLADFLSRFPINLFHRPRLRSYTPLFLTKVCPPYFVKTLTS